MYKIHLSQVEDQYVLPLPQALVDDLELKDSGPLCLRVEGDRLIIQKAPTRPASLHELFQDWQGDDHRPDELDWGSACGEELPW